jgi:hypothetical protein
MRASFRLGLLVLIAIPLSGCRYKGWESFTSATNLQPGLGQPTNPSRVVPGDPYAFGGIGAANGGLKPTTNYGLGADRNSPAPVNPKFDQPEMGSGQQPGELSNKAVPGARETNAPAMQPQPGDEFSGGAPISHG